MPAGDLYPFVAGDTPSLLWTWSRSIGDPVRCCRIGHTRTYSDSDGPLEAIAVVDELDRHPEDPVIDKFWYGAFFRTNLRDLLYACDAESVVIAGTVTQICVEDTARQAFHEGLKVIVAEDCVSSFAPDLHAATLKNIAMKFGIVLSSGRLREIIETSAPDA